MQLNNKDELHHLVGVLRAKKGDNVQLFDGIGNIALGTIHSISKKEVVVAVQTHKTTKQKPPQIILACALPKKSKFETIIEKATECGVDTIIPLQTERTEVKIKKDQMDKKIDRFNTVAINAAKQCKRTFLPKIYPACSMKNAVKLLGKEAELIIPSLQKKTTPLIDELKKIKINKSIKIAFFIGPEGDFTDKEYALASQSGATPVTLGPTILKVETAALTVCAVSNLLYN